MTLDPGVAVNVVLVVVELTQQLMFVVLEEWNSRQESPRTFERLDVNNNDVAGVGWMLPNRDA